MLAKWTAKLVHCDGRRSRRILAGPCPKTLAAASIAQLPLLEQRRSHAEVPIALRPGGALDGAHDFAYSTNYLVDVENAIIVDVEATTAIRQAEVLAAKRMIERSLERFDLYPSRLLGDSGYGSAEMLGGCADRSGCCRC